MAKKTKQEAAGEKPSVTNKYHVDPLVFVEVWNLANSTQEAADKLGMPKQIAAARASAYRQAGIRVKKMRREYKKALKIDEMNAVADRALKTWSEKNPGVNVDMPVSGASEQRPPLTTSGIRSAVERAIRELGFSVSIQPDKPEKKGK